MTPAKSAEAVGPSAWSWVASPRRAVSSALARLARRDLLPTAFAGVLARRTRRGVRAGASTGNLPFSSFGYYLDESNPDVVILRRRSGTFVAAFSARGATREGLVEAAEDDHRALLRGHLGSPGMVTEGHRDA